jgi:hypothetical protein
VGEPRTGEAEPKGCCALAYEDGKRVGTLPPWIHELPPASREERVEWAWRMAAVVEAARNVVAQWRGDISRKPHIGRLRDALDALESSGGEP